MSKYLYKWSETEKNVECRSIFIQVINDQLFTHFTPLTTVTIYSTIAVYLLCNTLQWDVLQTLYHLTRLCSYGLLYALWFNLLVPRYGYSHSEIGLELYLTSSAKGLTNEPLQWLRGINLQNKNIPYHEVNFPYLYIIIGTRQLFYLLISDLFS